MDDALAYPPKRVLVIDDEEAIRTYMTILLEDHGYEVLCAEDGDTGRRQAREHRPDLICLDIMMPKRSGITLYQDLKQDANLQNIPVIFVSAFSQIDGLELSAYLRKKVGEEIPEPFAYIEKPIDVASFVQLVASAMEQPDTGAV
jgi:CheY-like chemotaxis protein